MTYFGISSSDKSVFVLDQRSGTVRVMSDPASATYKFIGNSVVEVKVHKDCTVVLCNFPFSTNVRTLAPTHLTGTYPDQINLKLLYKTFLA